MKTSVCQRWRDQRGVYVPSLQIVRVSDYEVVEVRGKGADTECKAFFAEHHYLGSSYPSAIYRYRVVHVPTLLTAGYMVFSTGGNTKGYRKLGLPGWDLKNGILDLGRLALLDEIAPGLVVGANVESYAVAEALRAVRRDHGVETVISFSDPEPRTDAHGGVVFRGHIGTVYQAMNAWYTGRSRADDLLLLPDGTTIHRRALTKILARDQGRNYAYKQLLRGARAGGILVEPLRDDADENEAQAWLDRWLPRIAREYRHSGNLRYIFGTDRRARRAIQRAYPHGTDGSVSAGRVEYPKFHTLATVPRRRPRRENAEAA